MKALLFGALVIMVGLAGINAVSAVTKMSATTDGNSIRQFSITPGEPNVTTSSYDFPTTGSDNSSTTSSSISDTTSNWAGYISTGGTYSSISGSWTVPNVSASDGSSAADAAWIGIGGESSNDLIQVGTQNIVDNGQVSAG